MLSVAHRNIEECAFRALPAAHSEYRDGWMIRVSGAGPTRANCVTPLAPSAGPWSEPLAYCRALFADWKTPLIFRLIEHESNAALDQHLAALGFAEGASSWVMTLNLNERRPAPDQPYLIHLPADAWFSAMLRLDEASMVRKQRHVELLKLLPHEPVFGGIFAEEKLAAIALAVVEQEWMGLFDVCCAPEYRRQGYTRRLLEGLLAEAKRRGVRTAYLQVFTHNHAAIALYKSLGFCPAYRYRYRISRE